MQVFKNQKRSSLQMVNLFVRKAVVSFNDSLNKMREEFFSIEIIYIERLGCLC